MPSKTAAPDWWKESEALAMVIDGAWQKASGDYFASLNDLARAGDFVGLQEALRRKNSFGETVSKAVIKKTTALLVLIVSKAAKYWAKQIKKATSGKADESDIEEEIAAALAGDIVLSDYQSYLVTSIAKQLAQFIEAHPERILQPEIERQLAYLAQSDLTTSVDVSGILGRLERLSSQASYWERLSGVQVSRVWHAEGVKQANDAGMKRGVIIGPDDKKTCPVCRRMIGLEFSIPKMADKIERDLGLEDIGEYIAAWKFPRIADVDNISRQELASQERFPPFHPRCRHSVSFLF